jgi:uncharacterized membrane protein
VKNTKLWISILWVLVVLLAAARLTNTLFSLGFLVFLVLAAAGFALIHGALRYGWTGIVTFLVICLVVSNVLENTSILTGFPFGHYHYTGSGKLFLVPLFIGPAYFATAYLAWTLAIVLIGDLRRNGSWLITVAVPFVASAFMVMWDLTLDPSASTINHAWIWEQGGGYFGVPISNYLGWFFTVYVFLQLFAVYLHFRNDDAAESQTLPRAYYLQPIISYAVVGMTSVLSYLVLSGNSLVTDAAGAVWQTRSITEAEATVAIFTMIFVSVLAGVKLFQRSVAVDTVEARTEVAA